MGDRDRDGGQGSAVGTNLTSADPAGQRLGCGPYQLLHFPARALFVPHFITV